MPTKSYLKLYMALLATVLAAVLAGYALIQGLNDVRRQAWLEGAPQPLMSWLAVHPELIATVAADELSGTWSIVSAGNMDIDPVELERLGYGQVLARRLGDGVRWLYQLEDGSVLQLFVAQPYRNLAEIQAGLIAVLVGQGAVPMDEPALIRLGAHLGLLAEPVTELGQIPSQHVLERLSEEGVAYYQPDREDSAKVFLRLEGNAGHAGQILKVTLPPPFDPWAWYILLLIFGAVIAGLVSVGYLFFSRLQQRLASIENVVARIARGELDARVRTGNQPIIDRLGDAFNGMADHIQRLVGVQREMIHAVSHELRTPVARIRFGVQMLEDDDDPASRQKQLGAIDKDIQELDELIDEILTYARLEQGGPVLSFQNVNVAEVVKQVVGEQQSTRPGLTIESEFRGDAEREPMSDVEPRYLHRAIQNLVGNATRYARHQVRVICHFDEATCRIDVEDDGGGIPESDWDKVFTAFARLDDSRTRKSGGYGLGLSIVRRILFWHGGQAFVGRSERLGGARFSLVWPRHQPEPEVVG